MKTLMAIVFCLAALNGCTSTTQVDNSPGRATRYVPVGEPSGIQGVGIESQDIVSATDRMVRDLLSVQAIAGASTPPRVVIDSSYFRNDSSSRVNRDLFSDRLRVELVRAANGRIAFLGRHYADMVEDERELEAAGVVSKGSDGSTSRALGWDYRLGGRIATLDKIDARSGVQTRYHQITFELVQRGTGAIVWSNQYEFQKIGQEDVIYR